MIPFVVAAFLAFALMPLVDVLEVRVRRIQSGFLYGDFQFAIDPASDDFLHKGVFSCYRPVDPSTPMPTGEKSLSDESWRTLLYLAHDDKKQAFRRYADYYLSTNTDSSTGQIPTR